MGVLRTLLAIVVVCAHSAYGPVFLGGPLTVQVFYLISGFLNAHILRTNPAYADTRLFYVNRLLRLLPIYYLTAGLTAVYVLFIDHTVITTFLHAPLAAQVLLSVSQITVVGMDWIMFLGVRHEHLALVSDFHYSSPPLWRALLVPQAWSLGVEVSFYAIAPFVLRSSRVMLPLFVLSCAVRVATIAYGIGHADPWTYRFFPSELAIFLLGALSRAHLLPVLQQHIPGQTRRLAATLGTAVLIAACVTYPAMPLPDDIKPYLLLLVSAALLPLSFMYQQASRMDRAIGELSYPIYITHMLVIWVLAAVLARNQIHLSALSKTMAAVLLTCAFAWVLNRTVSVKVERLRSRLGSQQ